MLKALTTADNASVIINVSHIVKITPGGIPGLYIVKMADGETIIVKIDDLYKWQMAANAAFDQRISVDVNA